MISNKDSKNTVKTSRSGLEKIFNPDSIVILDGATGTLFQQQGMPAGMCPEAWAASNGSAVAQAAEAYINAGSQIILTPTFGGSPLKLKSYGLQDECEKLNQQIASTVVKAARGRALVAGDIGPCGALIKPNGSLSFHEAQENFRIQAQALLCGGVDLLYVETLMDLQEARAALSGCLAAGDVPVFITLTFDAAGRTLSGCTPESAVITLQAMGASAVGVNCSTGPLEMMAIVSAMSRVSKVPIIAKPNAGLPVEVDGNTVFPMGAGEFATAASGLAGRGASMIGGCCGTTPDHISALKARIGDTSIDKTSFVSSGLFLASQGSHINIIPGRNVRIIGERINPTGKKKLTASMKALETDRVLDLARAQQKAGAHILDVNAGVPGGDEKTILETMTLALARSIDMPLCIDTTSPEALETALINYPGRALINSISAEQDSMNKLLSIARKWGAAFIALPLDGANIPEYSSGRIAFAERIIEAALSMGFQEEDIVVDGLVMALSHTQTAVETLLTISWANSRGLNSVAGLSNVSFGLPERKNLNASMLSMAVSHGLSMCIANPGDTLLMNTLSAAEALSGRDPGLKKYIQAFSHKSEEKIISRKDKPSSEKGDSIIESVEYAQAAATAVTDGNPEKAVKSSLQALESGLEANIILQEHLIPAISSVGDLFESGNIFLPQLLAAAESMEKSFSAISPHIIKTAQDIDVKPIMFATVKGDIHDIGKNIVCLMLRNHGFKVIDLGRDISPEDIIKSVKESKPSVIGLSALMTTTLNALEKTVQLLKEECPDTRVMIGGAVVTADYARRIEADGYADDAAGAVRLAKSLTS